jgi:uncharacterized membrane protein YadS
MSSQIGTLVKLVRVGLWGPIIVAFSLIHRTMDRTRHLPFGRLIPWFIVGFIALAAMRSVGVLPPILAESLREVRRGLTIVAMAALGLDVQLQAVRRVGGTVAVTVVLSWLVLVLLSTSLIWGLGIG